MEVSRNGQRFGAHMSVAGGLENAFHAGRKAGCDCLQIFVKNQRQWSAPPLTPEQIRGYRQAEEDIGLHPVVAHGSYLINLAAPDPVGRRRASDALVDELTRCAALGVLSLVLHPGAHMGRGVDEGITHIQDSLNYVLAQTRKCRTCVLMETTAGQGTSIGHDLEHLGRIIQGVQTAERVMVCLDTCHLYAAGYDLADEHDYERMMGELSRHIGLDRVRCIHVNDSKRECGSRVDRHEHIGKGRLGLAGFTRLLNDPRLAKVPRILETPKGVDGRGTDLDRINLKRLRRLVGPQPSARGGQFHEHSPKRACQYPGRESGVEGA